MRLDDLAGPFRVEQIVEALRRFLGLHLLGVVGDRAKGEAEARERPVRILVLGGEVLGHVLGHERREDALVLPDDEVRRVGRVDDVDAMDLAGVFLADALEHALGAAALDAHLDARILRLEGARDPFRQRQVDRGVVVDGAFLLRGLDQLRRDRRGRRRLRQHLGRRRKRAGRNRGRSFQDVASRNLRRLHCRSPSQTRSGAGRRFVVQPASTRQRSGGRCSQTDDPGATFSAGEATTRICVPSAASTM